MQNATRGNIYIATFRMLLASIKPFLNHARLARDFILDLLFPIECVNCKKDKVWICQACLLRIGLNSQQSCPGCHSQNSTGEVCPDCRLAFHFDGVLVAGSYKDESLSRLIKEYKYGFCKGIAPDLARFFLLFLRNFLNLSSLAAADQAVKNKTALLLDILNDREKTILVPVPLHKRRLRWRGFNQAEELAEKFATLAGFSCHSRLLERSSYNQPQAKLNRTERRRNLHGRFHCGKIPLTVKNIILIDDVVTTGATLDECAKVLKRNGAQTVWGLVIAKN